MIFPLLAPDAHGLIDTGPSPLSLHALQDWQLCQRRWAYKALLGVDSSRRALDRGTLGHVALAHHYTRRAAQERGLDPDRWLTPEEAVAVKAERMVPRDGQVALIEERKVELRSYRDDAIGAYRTYCQTCVLERVRVVGVEVVVQGTLRSGAHTEPFTQRLDCVVEVDGKGQVWDHKFVSLLGSREVRRYAMSVQFLGLWRFGRAIFQDRFDGPRLNAVVWPSATRACRVERIRTEPAPEAQRSYPDLVVSLLRARRAAVEQLGTEDPWAYPPTGLHGEVCVGPYGVCSGYELCRVGRAALEFPLDRGEDY